MYIFCLFCLFLSFLQDTLALPSNIRHETTFILVSPPSHNTEILRVRLQTLIENFILSPYNMSIQIQSF